MLSILNLGAVLVIVALDWLTPAGIVVGILLCIPIILTSLTADAKQVWLTFGLAVIGFVLAAAFGSRAISPPAVWIPNRIFAFLTLPASCGIALLLQSQRLRAQRARDQAIRARDLNRLLMSILAHHLRSPLAMAVESFDYVKAANAQGQPLDESLLSEVESRLNRGISAIDNLLNFAHGQIGRPAEEDGPPSYSAVELATELEGEIRAFTPEAAARGKVLLPDLSDLGGRRFFVDVLVLRQAVAILLDNAIRHALPGSIRLSAAASGEEVRVLVEDEGPGLSAAMEGPRRGFGAGLGLELCRALVAHAGGSLEATRDEPGGTTFLLRLPASPERGQAKASNPRPTAPRPSDGMAMQNR